MTLTSEEKAMVTPRKYFQTLTLLVMGPFNPLTKQSLSGLNHSPHTPAKAELGPAQPQLVLTFFEKLEIF